MRILFIHNAPTRFVTLDYRLLAQHFAVTDCYIHSPRTNWANIARQVKQHDIVVGWFASWHTLLPFLVAKWLGRPSLLIVGGYDTANVPEANYGSQRGGLRRLIARMTIKSASRLMANSYSAKRETIENVGVSAKKITVIYHGIPVFPAGDMQQRKPIVLTVGNVWQENLLRKGLYPFVETAQYFPNLRFVLVGKWHDDSIETLRQIAPPNVEFTGFVTDQQLQELFQTAAVYVQASLHEGFGMSVAEAMLGGCIPVVTQCGSLPEVVRSHGVIVANQQPELIAAGIREVISAEASTRQAARVHILNTFPLSYRQNALHHLISTL